MIRHVSFMRLPHISLIAAYFSKVHISCVFFPRKLVLLTTILILFVFPLPTSIRFRYLGHLIANRMAPSMCLGPCGTRWGSWFQAILYQISAHICCLCGLHIFFKMPHKTDMPRWWGVSAGLTRCCGESHFTLTLLIQLIMTLVPQTRVFSSAR